MVNLYIYAKDFSNSTRGVEYYHNNGLKTIKKFKEDVDRIKKELSTAEEPPGESKIVYLHWGHDCYEVDEDTTIQTYLKFEGDQDAPRPDSIINWIKNHYDICDENKKIRLLYIITHGLIDKESAEKCFGLNSNIHYENVVFHGFHPEPRSIDLTVTSSFYKGCCKVFRNNCLHYRNDVKEFDYDKINVNNFLTEKESLKSYIKMKYNNSVMDEVIALQEMDKLKKLRDRLFKEVEASNEEKQAYLNTKDRNMFLQEFFNTKWYINLKSAKHGIKIDIDKSISTLINYIVNDSKTLSFDILKFQTDFRKYLPYEQIQDINFEMEQEIEFPDIILDDDKGVPVIILTICNLLHKILFNDNRCYDRAAPARFNKFKSNLQCPLLLVKDKDISECIGYFYTLNVYKLFLSNKTNTEPRTRKPFYGGIVLTDTKEFDKYNDFIVAATFFEGKKIHYNVGLFYYMLWKNCENKEWMDRNVVELFKKYTMRRISETVCKIGLSSLPLDPQENTSLLTALWYCVEMSSCIFKNDPQNFMHERLRMYHGIADFMIEILKHFDYDLDLESIEKRRELISYVSTLKKIQRRECKYYYILEKIFRTVDGFLISEIENPNNLYKLNYLKLHHKEMFPDDIVDEKVNIYDYIHLMHIQGDLDASKAGNSMYEICEKTYRPFFVIDQDKSFYADLVKNTKKVIINYRDKNEIEVTFEAIDTLEFNRVVSLYNLFIRCVEGSKKYPTLSEFAQYVLKRKRFIEKLVTIFPPNVYFDLKNVYERYQKVVTNVKVEDFIMASKSYVNRRDRIKAEDRVKFSSDDEIEKFLSSEELKVNLKKANRKSSVAP